MKENALIQRTGFAQNAARAPFFRGILHQDVDGFATHDIADDLGINPRDRREAPRPISAIMRPRYPGRLVRFPFGGHAETE